MAPVLALLGAGVVLLVRHPSAPAAVAFAVVAGVGLALEAVVWRHFRRRWAGDTSSHPMDIPAPLRAPVRLGLSAALLVGAITWKAVGLGESWMAGFLVGLGLLAFYLVVWLVERWIQR